MNPIDEGSKVVKHFGNLGPGFKYQKEKKRLLHIDLVIGALQKEIDESDNERV